MSIQNHNLNAEFLEDDPGFIDKWKFDLLERAMGSVFLKYVLFFIVIALTLCAVWLVWLRVSWRELENAQGEQIKLQSVVALKLLKTAQLEPLQLQKAQILRDIESTERVLARKGEMASLLKEINQAGLGQGLQFELFRPKEEVLYAHYAQLPISLRVFGSYHQIGFFAADIASMPRLVALDNLLMTPLKEGGLMLEATLHTYRHLELEDRPAINKPNTAQGDKP